MLGSRPMRVLLLRLLGLAAFIGALWVLQAVNWAVRYRLNSAFGLIPREVEGLDGILGMPLLHGGFGHLMSNTPPLLVMGALLAATATRALVAVNAVIVRVGGLLVWLLGSAAHPYRHLRPRLRVAGLPHHARSRGPLACYARRGVAGRAALRHGDLGRAARPAGRVLGGAPLRGAGGRGCRLRDPHAWL